MSVQEIQKKLKESIMELYKQITIGCYRAQCYNSLCAKSIAGKKKYSAKPQKEIVAEIIILLKEQSYEKLKCINQESLKALENRYNGFLNNNIVIADQELKTLPMLNLNLNKISEYYSTTVTSTIDSELKGINNYFSFFSDRLNTTSFDFKRQDNVNLVYFVFDFMAKSLIIILSHPNFFWTDTTSIDYIKFFEHFRQIKRMAKQCLSGIIGEDKQNIKKEYLNVFKELIDSKEKFQAIIENCQNFLTWILFNIGANNNEDNDEEENFDKKMLDWLVSFVKIFKTLHSLNTIFKVLSEKLFYNDGMSKHLNFKRECKIYNQILRNEYQNKKPFCLINYIWLFDAAAKSDMLTVFNANKQNNEILNSINPTLLAFNAVSWHSVFFILQIHRDNLIEDTLNTVSNSSVNLQKPWKVKFIGEQGVDEGGVRKEFFLLLVRQIFDANFGMFSYNEKTRLFWFNLYSFEPKIKYELIGIILGLALFNNVILDIKFPLVIYKKLLGIKPVWADFWECEPELYQTFTYWKTTNDTGLKDWLSTTFTVTVDRFGEKVVIPLREGGSEIFIDETNKTEYVDWYIDWFFNKSIEEFFKYFSNGFYRVFDKKLAQLLTPEELELIICGTLKLDFYELEKAAKYEDGYDKNSQTCKDFWEILHKFDEDLKKKFLFFVTGCDRAPINGLGSLVITISKFGSDSDKWPCAHTCFNHWLLPDYKNKEKLNKLLLIAISNSEGFGMI